MKVTFAAPILLVTVAFVGIGVSSHAAAQQTRLAADGIYTAAQAKRGEPLFLEHCSPCHGADLSGTDFGPGVTDGELLSRWKNRSVGDLFELMRSTMPLNSPGGLSVQQNTDILAFILQKARFPAGPSELSGQVGVLNQIRFAARTP